MYRGINLTGGYLFYVSATEKKQFKRFEKKATFHEQASQLIIDHVTHN